MQNNPIKSIWQNGGAAVNGWLHINSTWSAEIMAHAGFDSLTIDLQHGFTGFESTMAMIQVISGTPTVPMARVPWNEPGIIGRLLDAGALGIICPMVNTRAQCEAFVGACRYFPAGYRSLGPTRSRLVYGAEYAAQANEQIIVMAMIETAEALDNIDDILSVPGLDAIYVGTGDLALTLGGRERVDYTEPALVEALDLILAKCRAHGIIAGLHNGSPEYASRMIDKGFQFVTAQSDGGFLADHAKEAVAIMRGGAHERERSVY